MFEQSDIPGVFLIKPNWIGDARGAFCETFVRARYEPLTGPLDWVQDNHSKSVPKGVLRGLHFQIPPFAQDKLVRCVRGALLDVAVDIRAGSPTFGRYVSAVLSEENGRQIFIPKGFAHGFLTLEPNTEIIYKVTNYYAPAHDRGICWDDPTLAIAWGVSKDEVVLSQKDAQLPALAAAGEYFKYPG